MIRAAPPEIDRDVVRALLEPAAVERMLADALPIDWPSGRPPSAVRIERCWPTSVRADDAARGAAGPTGGFVFEWSFMLANGQRHVLFGRHPAPDGFSEIAAMTPRITAGGLRGLRACVPEWNLCVHSLDADPHMPHLARCLDPREMAEQLSPFMPLTRARGLAAALECRPLGYRAGRRAAIGYARLRRGRSRSALVGKTFSNGRGARLARFHVELADKLATSSDGRVRVPVPLGYLPALNMTLFDWAAGRKIRSTPVRTHEHALLAIDALATLHGVELDGLVNFSAPDECAIIRRWHAALAAAGVTPLDTGRLVDALLRAAETVRPTQFCTLHRDFYDRQLLVQADTVTLLDLDTLSRGEACIDLGNFLAHQYLGALERPGQGDVSTDMQAALVACYEQRAGPVDRRNLAFYTASALFRVGAVHALRSATRRHAPGLWRRAAEMVGWVEDPSCQLWKTVT